MYGEYEVSSVIYFQEDMPEHLIEPATEKILAGRYEIGIYDVVPSEWLFYYYPEPCCSYYSDNIPTNKGIVH